MAQGVEPAPRYGHLAAAVDRKLYVWGGLRRDLPAVHDDPTKKALTSVVDILDLQVKDKILKKIYIYIYYIYDIGQYTPYVGIVYTEKKASPVEVIGIIHRDISAKNECYSLV